MRGYPTTATAAAQPRRAAFLTLRRQSLSVCSLMKIWPAYSRRVKHFACFLAISLICATSGRSQAAAEFRPRSIDSKDWPKHAVRAPHGMVATDEQLGSQAGVEILKRGGE